MQEAIRYPTDESEATDGLVAAALRAGAAITHGTHVLNGND